jgi:hypothetical protein
MVRLSWLDSATGCMQFQKVVHTASAWNHPGRRSKIPLPDPGLDRYKCRATPLSLGYSKLSIIRQREQRLYQASTKTVCRSLKDIVIQSATVDLGIISRVDTEPYISAWSPYAKGRVLVLRSYSVTEGGNQQDHSAHPSCHRRHLRNGRFDVLAQVAPPFKKFLSTCRSSGSFVGRFITSVIPYGFKSLYTTFRHWCGSRHGLAGVPTDPL